MKVTPDFIELYILKEDVNELNNLALDEKYAARIKNCAQKCDTVIRRLMAQRVNDP